MTDNCYRELLHTSKVPIVFPQRITWDILKWTLNDWSDAFQNKLLTFRCGKKICKKTPVWESQCETEHYTFKEFISLVEDDSSTKKKWWYFDYKHISDNFHDTKDLFANISWSELGFPEKVADDSTIWIGSPGSHTACHFDTYGFNVVAQIFGKKRWILFPPSESENLKPTRVPYEESSVYSSINFSCSEELKKHLKFEKCYIVDLNPGDVLFVPAKWWHYVENLSIAISVNMWIPATDDDYSRLDEALVKYFISGLVNNVSDNLKNFLLNPNELDMNFGTMDLEVIKFCKKKIEEISESIPARVETNLHDLTVHIHRYRVIQAVSLPEFQNILAKCAFSHNLITSEEPLPEEYADTLTSIINAFCHPAIMCQIRNKFLH